MTGAALDVFAEQRPMLFGIAYRMLGSVADAEDILQDAWLKWSSVDVDSLEQPRAYLARTVTNLSINRLRSASAQRESYAGPWLPEPLVTEDDAGSYAEQSEAVSLAMLVVLETLSPLERAVFILNYVFGFSLAEIARLLDRSEPEVTAWTDGGGRSARPCARSTAPNTSPAGSLASSSATRCRIQPSTRCSSTASPACWSPPQASRTMSPRSTSTTTTG